MNVNPVEGKSVSPSVDASTVQPIILNVEPMKPQEQIPTGWRDPAFAVLFYVCALCMLILAAALGIPVMAGSSSNAENSNETFAADGSVAIVLYIFIGICFISSLVSAFIVKVLIIFADHIIKYCFAFEISILVVAILCSLIAGSVGGAAFCAVVLALNLGYIFIVRRRIPFASANLKVAATAVQAHPGTFGVAILFLLVQVVWVFIWIIAFIGVIAQFENQTHSYESIQSASLEENGGTCSANYDCNSGFCKSSVCTDPPSNLLPTIGTYFLLLMLDWGIYVCRNIIHCTVAGTIATWWFAANSEGATKAALNRSCTTSFGSICFGSLILAIIELVKGLLRAKKNGCLACICECICRVFRYFNRWAFVYVGVHGYSYIQASKSVLQLFRSRGFDAIINDTLASMVFFFCMLTIGILSSAISVGIYYIYPDMLHNAAVLIALFGFILGICISSIPFSVISSSIATIFVCFAEDPAIFARTHPSHFTPLMNSWHKAYPDVVVANGYHA